MVTPLQPCHTQFTCHHSPNNSSKWFICLPEKIAPSEKSVHKIKKRMGRGVEKGSCDLKSCPFNWTSSTRERDRRGEVVMAADHMIYGNTSAAMHPLEDSVKKKKGHPHSSTSRIHSVY